MKYTQILDYRNDEVCSLKYCQEHCWFHYKGWLTCIHTFVPDSDEFHVITAGKRWHNLDNNLRGMPTAYEIPPDFRLYEILTPLP